MSSRLSSSCQTVMENDYFVHFLKSFKNIIVFSEAWKMKLKYEISEFWAWQIFTATKITFSFDFAAPMKIYLYESQNYLSDK